MQYIDYFKDAVQRTGALGLGEHNFSFKTEHTYEAELQAWVLQNFRPRKEDLFAKCNVACQQILTRLHKETAIKGILTIGTVILGAEDCFCSANKFDENFIVAALKKGVDSLAGISYSHHAWITLDSQEIFDPTFPISYLMLRGQNIDDMEDGVPTIFKRFTDFSGGMYYKPVLVGDSFYRIADKTRYALALSETMI
ncbi:MAG: hypothetical protein NTV32_03590 [Gammaproteobacteria bacterium]|nr:hypothetical protein [Gammaproteobacteria bacterium]